MSNPVVFPPLSRFGRGQCAALRKRWHIHKRDVAARAGVHPTMIERFEKGTLRGAFEAKAAVYDALLDLVLASAQKQVKEIEKARIMHRGR